MKNNNEKMPNAHLHELMIDGLRDIYSAERQLTKGLKKMKTEAENDDLKAAFEQHLNETEGHLDRLKEVFASLDLPARAKTCKAMKGLIEEAEEIMESFDGDPAKDAALIAAAQKIEHYEIATYGTLVTFADMMGHEEVKNLLQETLDEEKATDKKLTEIAVGQVN